MAIKDKRFWQTKRKNTISFQHYFNRLASLSIAMFDWKNLPKGIDERFLELVLFGEGVAVFFKDDVIGFCVMRVTLGGTLDIYQIPTERRAFADNGYTNDLNSNNSVIIFNDLLHTTIALDVEQYAQRLANLDSVIDINCNAQKTPILVSCDETQRLTLANLYKMYDGNTPVIFGDKNITPNSLSVLSTGSPYVADKLYDLKVQVWNEALTFLGISNVNITKKERLITDEVLRNQGGTISSRYSRLEARRQACKKINEMFDLDIWVDYREDYIQADTPINEGDADE